MLPANEAVEELELRANHKGGPAYDWVKASGMLPYLSALQSLEKIVRRGHVEFDFMIKQLEGECVRVTLNDMSCIAPTATEALLQLGANL